jgi:hypothetical protein
MTSSQKWLCILSLVAAALLSLFLSFWGLMFFAWNGFPPKDHAAAAYALGVPYFLAFPIALTATLIWKPATRLLWILVPLPWLGVLGFSYQNFKTAPLDFVISVASCAYPVVPLVILASLVQYGTKFYKITHDSKGYKWYGAVNGHAS